MSQPIPSEPITASPEKAKKKKRLILWLIIGAVIAALIAGTVTAVLLLNSGGGKKIIKKVVVVQNDDGGTGENESLDEPIPDYSDPSSADDENESYLIKIIKRIKRIFTDYSYQDDVPFYRNADAPVKTLYLKDYGAKGDGKTDDGPAIFKAISALTDCGPGSKLIFEKGKTYYAKSVTMSSLIYISGVRGLTVDGQGSTVLLDALTQYLTVTESKDCTVQNLHFDLKNKPAFTAVCLSTDVSEGSALMRADRDIGLESGKSYSAPNSGWFGVINRHDSRYHMYISRYEMVDREQKTFRIYFTTDTNTRAWLSNGNLQSNGMICPTPGVGHLIERGFTVSSNDGFSMKNVDIHSCARFGMLINNNDGKLTFDAVDFVPADNDLDRNMNFTSWRDAFHTKDNRAAITWKNCTATGNYDDIFNISSSTMYVSDYNVAKNRITLVWPESGKYYPIKAGDELSVIDAETGEDCGTAKVKRIIRQSNDENVFVLEKPLERLNNSGVSMLAFFKNRCAPGSVITNCDFNGTFRFRGPLTIQNSEIFNLRTWIDVYGSTEGPVPENITYRNCTISSGAGTTFIIGANSGNTGKNGTHVKDILFENCTLDSNSLSVYESDEAYVHLKNCKEHDGTAIADR